MKKTKPLAGEKLVDIAVKQAQEKLAENIVIIDLRGLNGSADWFIICQGDNVVHTRAIADGIADELSAQGTHTWHREGEEEGRWILIDYSDVIIHCMIPELREYYGIEKIWSEGIRSEVPSPKSGRD